MNSQNNYIKSYGKSLFDKFVVQILWTLLAAIFTGLSAFFLSRKFLFTDLEIVLSVIIAIFTTLTLSYIIYRRINKRLPVFSAIHPEFHMLREERIHKWINADNYTHKRRYTLKALKNGLSQYTDKFYWTGSEFTLKGGDSDYTVELEKKDKNIYNVYNFKFTSPLKKNCIIEVEASWEARGPAKPFFSTTIEEPTDLLVMTVMLYPGCGIKYINCDIESYKGARIPLISKKEKLNTDGEYTWQVKNPKILHHYEINWKI